MFVFETMVMGACNGDANQRFRFWKSPIMNMMLFLLQERGMFKSRIFARSGRPYT